MSDSWIMRNTGMDKNELLRFKQISGLAELFRDRSFGLSDEWYARTVDDEALRAQILQTLEEELNDDA